MARTACIMLIDEDDINNYITSRLISKLGICESLIKFSDGESSLSYIAEKIEEGFSPPDIIILDIHLPVMSGFHFIESFKKLPFKNKKESLLIGLISSTYPENNDKFLKAGCHFVFEKPLTRTNLELVLRKINESSSEASLSSS